MGKLDKQALPYREGQQFNPYGLFAGLYIPDCVAKTKLLSPLEKLVWGRLCKRAGKDGRCYPSLTRIASDLGISRNGAIKSVASLVSKGFLEKHRQPGRRTNHYVFLWHSCLNEGLKVTSQPSGTEVVKFSTSSTLSEPDLVNEVDLSSSQSRPKEIHKENQKKTTTTTVRHQGVLSSGGGDGGCGGFSLSEKEARYIELRVKRAVAEGEIRKSPERYKLSLLRKATQSQLDMSDYEELVRWSQQGQDIELKKPARDSIQRKKDELHDELQRLSSESREWWGPLSRDHPAKRDIRPRYVSEDIWIRTQFKKYGNKQEAING